MRILFYTGYSKSKWSPLDLRGVGGSEIAVTEITGLLTKFGHQVFVAGSIEPGSYDQVRWLDTTEIHNQYYDMFDVIITINYIHGALEFKNYNAHKIFWAHNTDYHPWYKGEELEDSEQYLDLFDTFVCLTEWHKKEWSAKYNIPLDKIKTIGNGINRASFVGRPKKKKNRFIWSSAPERGLEELLSYWPNVRYNIPDATLDIYTPSYAIDQLEYITDKLDVLRDYGVTSYGSTSQEVLHQAMLKAEYWLYLTEYKETYCITALEMQLAKVLPITTKVAALNETVNSGIKLDYSETVFHLAIEILKRTSTELKTKSIDTSYEWAKRQSWQARALEWHNFLKEEHGTRKGHF